MNANIDFLKLLPDHNPFSSRATRPGAFPYRFLNGKGSESLIADLRQNGWWGEILGPHGSGKSTLICSLLAPLRAAGKTVRQYTLHSGEKRIPIAGNDLKAWDSSTLVVIDGYEQLGGWNRATLKKICRQQQAGLLVTAHHTVGLPALYTTAVTLDLAHDLVRQLLPAACQLISDKDVVNSFERWQGNLREVFFELYDQYEARRTATAAQGGS